MATPPKTTRRLKIVEPASDRASRAVADADLKSAAIDELADADLWARYRNDHEQAIRDLLIERYYPLVHVIAQRMASRLPASVQVDDLCSAGVFGLIDAIDGFDPEYGVKFETYCTTRVRGAMLDEMRQLDWAPRQVRTSQARMDQARNELEKDLGRPPSDDELMDYLDLTAEEFEGFRRKADAAQITSLTQASSDDDDGAMNRLQLVANDTSVEPGEDVAVREMFPQIGSLLSANERIIMVLYYHEAMTMKEIGQIQGISESRVCQIHGKIVSRLKNALRGESA